jgi:hypothetical protein
VISVDQRGFRVGGYQAREKLAIYVVKRIPKKNVSELSSAIIMRGNSRRRHEANYTIRRVAMPCGRLFRIMLEAQFYQGVSRRIWLHSIELKIQKKREEKAMMELK